MDPNESDWLGSCKSQPARDVQIDGNVARSWQWRERGLNPARGAPTRTVLEHVAEDRLVHKGPLNIKCCDLPGYPRSTFLMVFSPDGTTVASTHGNHNIYLTELASGKHVRILKGHPRTPWCIAFHPSHAELVGSGCLGGQVRVWDSSGGSEVWTVDKETVIASIAFHPRDQLLVVATFNELYFWDWSQPQPFTKVCTNNINEKVRYVAFDSLGHKLITGIALWGAAGGGSGSLLQTAGPGGTGAPGAAPPGAPGPTARGPDGSAQDLIFTSYHNLVQRYDSLVRNYHRLFLARNLSTNTTDRGTDPMEVDGVRTRPPAAAAPAAAASSARNSPPSGDAAATASGAGRERAGEADAGPAGRLLSLDVLSLGGATAPASTSTSTSRTRDSSTHNEASTSSRGPQDGHLIFGSRSSAFQPLIDSSAESFNIFEQHRRILRRVLPNPFSSSSLSQTDLRHRISNEHSVSRTRAFSRASGTTDDTTEATREDLEQRHNSSSRTRGFQPQRYDEMPSGLNHAQNRYFQNERMRQVAARAESMAETLRRRKALQRLLELERIAAEETEAPRQTRNSTLENMLFGRRDAISSSELIPPPIMSHFNVFEDLESSSGPGPSQRDDSRYNPLNYNTPRPTNPPAVPPSPRNNDVPQEVNFVPTYSRVDEPELTDRHLRPRPMDYLISAAHRDTAPATPARSTGNSRPVTTSEQPVENSAGASTSRTESHPGPGSAISQNITHSLDIIRDILRDSGSRLLNLITDMSLSTLEGVGETPDRAQNEREPEDDAYSGPSSRGDERRRRFLLPSTSASDSDSDRSLEVNIYRTRNATFPENRSTDADNTETERTPRPTNRMVVDLNLGEPEDGAAPERRCIRRTLNNNRINITVSNNRFRLRTNNVENSQASDRRSENNSATASTNVGASTSADSTGQSREPLPTPRPSTSRDTDWLYNSMGLPSGERPTEPMSAADALRKVKLGITALQQHTARLTDMWLRGTRTSMRDTRLMWEDLRRHVVALQRQTSRNETPSYFARSTLERCNTLSDLSRRLIRCSEVQDSLRRNFRVDTSETAIQANVPNNEETPTESPMDIGAGPSNQDAQRPRTSRENPSDAAPSAGSPRSLAWGRIKRSALMAARTAFKARSSPSTRRRMQSTGHRWRPGEEQRRRQRIVQRIEQYVQGSRSAGRARLRENMRHVELHYTRHEIRLRAMQVLSIMFNMMMACLEEGELSSQIIVMLRTLKKALGVTCLLLMANRSARRDPASSQNMRRRNSANPSIDNPQNEASPLTTAVPPQPMDQTASTSVVPPQPSVETAPIHNNDSARLQSTVNSEGTPFEARNDEDAQRIESSTQSSTSQRTENAPFFLHGNQNSSHAQANERSNPSETERRTAVVFPPGRVRTPPRNLETFYNSPSTSASVKLANPSTQNPDTATRDVSDMSVDPQPSTSNRWSNRLAVQISAANNNKSDTANTRKDIYLERKRQKALHRHNPVAHPLGKRKTIAPLISHRIPTPRVVPLRRVPPRVPPRNRSEHPRRLNIELNASDEPVPGPSDPQPSTSADNAPSVPGPGISRQEYRAGLFRFAQFHAARLRNATRNRYRIRLYTPSSVREMVDILTTGGNEREPESPPTLNNAPENRRPFSTYRPRLLTVRNNLESLNQGPEGSRPFGSVLNNVSVPLVQVNNLPLNDQAGGGDAPPRVNEYLQPIILAQNALVVEEAGGGGLLEAGLISESLLVPVHRVQAWDFTRGVAPDIKDSTKNLVVQRCKIHNDASIDISRDGRLLVALLPVHRMRNMSHRLGVYSLEWGRLGQCLHTAVLEQSAVSVALSPTARHLAVGLGSRRVTTLPHNRNNVFALLFRLADDDGPVNENSRQCGLIPVRILDHNWEHGFTSLNCLRWAPEPGQGLLYANNTGQLIIMS